MSMKLMVAAMSAKVGNPLRKLVLIKLADQANDDGRCWPSFRHIADQCEMSRRSVITHINQLLADGFLSVQHRKIDDKNSSNIYHLHIEKGIQRVAHNSAVSVASGGAEDSPPSAVTALGGGAGDSPPSAGAAPGGGAGAAPRTSHSFEPVNEPNTYDPSADADRSTVEARPPRKPDYSAEFEAIWRTYPKREGSNPKTRAWQAYHARIRDGTDPATIAAGVARYYRYCQAKGSIGTEFVMQAQRFFGKNREFENDWIITETNHAAGQRFAEYSSKSDRDDEAMRRYLEQNAVAGCDDEDLANASGVEVGHIASRKH